MAAAAAAGAASAELVIGWCIFGLLLLVGETLGVPQGLDGGGAAPPLVSGAGTLLAPPRPLLRGLRGHWAGPR